MRREKEISGAAAEHVAQSNQYFLVTVGIGVRNKPHRKSQANSDTSENSSSEREMVRLFGITVIGCHSLLLCHYTCLITFVTELLFGTSFLLLLRHLLLLPSSHPRCCYNCDIFLFSIPEVIWLVKLHLFPRPPPWSAFLRFPVWVAAITLALSLVHDLGRQTPSHPSSWR